MADHDTVFLAHVLTAGKANLTADETTRLQALASRWLMVGDKVATIDSLPDGSDQAFSGTVAEVDNATIKVTLDTPIQVSTTTGMAMATELTVPSAWVAKVDSTTTAAARS